MGKEQEVESLSIKLNIDTVAVIQGLTAVNNLFTKISDNAYTTTVQVNRMLAALGQLSGVHADTNGVDLNGTPYRRATAEPTPPNDAGTTPPPPPPPQPTPRPTVAPAPAPILPRTAPRTNAHRLDYTTRKWVNRIKRLVMPLITVFGARALWKGFNEGVKMIDTYRKQIGMSTAELDKWAKANQYAGGSQKAFLDTMAKFVKETGKSGDEFIEMMLHLNEMSKKEQEAFLKTKGYSEEAVALFLKNDADIIRILKQTKEIAFSDDDVKIVKGFNEQWERFKVLSQGIGNIFIRGIQPVFTAVLKLVNGICDLIVRHKTTFKVLLSLLMVAFGGALIRQMRMGASAGGLLVRVLQALTRGVFSFSRALLASPLTWWLLALGALYLILEDIYYFATDGESVIGDLLNEWFGKENTEAIKKDLAEIVEGIIEFGGIVKEVAKDIFPYFVKLSKFMVKLQTTYLKAIFLIISAIIYGIAKIGRWIGKGIGYLVVNVPKWLDKVGKFVSDTWEGIKKGTEEVWNGIKNFIGSTIDGIIGFFKNMWKTACDYVNKTIDKLQELNPFQERSEDGGVWLHDFIYGDPTAGIVGTHALPTYNINSDQKNNITINTNESAKAVKKTIERYSKDLIPSYVPMMN